MADKRLTTVSAPPKRKKKGDVLSFLPVAPIGYMDLIATPVHVGALTYPIDNSGLPGNNAPPAGTVNGGPQFPLAPPASTPMPIAPPPSSTTTMPIASAPVSSPAPSTPVISAPADTTPAPAPSTPAPSPSASTPSTVTPPAQSASPVPPVANAGLNQTITASTAMLDGSGSSDPNGGTLSYAWSLVSGPNNPAVSGASTVQPQVSGLVPGTYIFQLTVFNSVGQEAQATVSITVQSTTTTLNAGTATLNTGTVIATAPTGGGMGPYAGGGGGGGGGGGDQTDQSAPPPTPWDNVKAYLKHNWWWMALLIAGAVAVGSADEGN